MVVCSLNGTPRDPINLIREYNRLISKANLNKISFHDLRHIFATLLLEDGENPKVVSEILGHSRVSTTLDIYTHIDTESQMRVANHLANLIMYNKKSGFSIYKILTVITIFIYSYRIVWHTFYNTI